MLRFQEKIRRRSIFGIMLVSFFVLFAILVIQTLVNVKDINDTWILSGLFPVFVLFTVVYVAIVSFSENLKLIALVSSIYLGTVTLIPQLKYVFIYGYFDPLPHYGFLRDIVASGHVPTIGYYPIQYGPSPGSHMTMAELSIVTGSSPLVAMKIFLSVGPFIIPLAVYFVLKNLDFQSGLSKVIIIVSVITSPTLYRFVGTVGAFPLYTLVIYLFLLVASRGIGSRSNFVMFILFGTGVVFSHDVTAFFLIVAMLSVMAIYLCRKHAHSLATSSKRLLFFVTAFIVIDLAHLALSSIADFSYIIRLIQDTAESIFEQNPPGAITYYSGYYTLTLLQQVQILAVRMGRDIVTVFLLVLAPMALFRLKLKGQLSRAFYFALTFPTLIAFMMFALPFFIRSYIVNRGLIYLAAFAPFLVGITVYWLLYSRHFRFRNVIFAIGTISLLSISLIQTYPCEPILPKISTNFGTYYFMDLRAITTAYDRSVINFLSTYDSHLTFATDSIIRSQVLALTEPSFQTLLISVDDITSGNRINAQLILVSLDGNTHIIVSGSGAIDYAQYVLNITQTDSIIYSNSRSYLLLNSETRSP